MVYPSITETMIKHSLDTDVKIVPMKSYVVPEKPVLSQPLIEETNDLENAIKKQQDFIKGKIKN